LETGNDLVAEPLQYSSDFSHSFKMKISEISLYFNGLRFHLSILPKSNYLPLCCFTGIPYGDMCRLSAEDLVAVKDGTLWIKTSRKKTKISYEVPLLDIPLYVLEKYRDAAPEGKLLPMYSNSELNGALKTIAGLCGIEQRLVFHAGRHTSATTVLLSNGVPLETVSKILGHERISTTQIYAHVTDDKVEDDTRMLDAKVAERFSVAI
jgi:integrase